MRSPSGDHTVLAVSLALAMLLAATSPAISASGPAVRGGGVVDGELGITSQLGFTATSHGGSFLCVMAGRSGGFPFGDWNDGILQMQVQGRVTPDTLEIDGVWSQFEGIAKIHIVGLADGQVVTATVMNVRFVSTQKAGGAGEARHILDLPDLGLSFGGPIGALMKSGHITIWE